MRTLPVLATINACPQGRRTSLRAAAALALPSRRGCARSHLRRAFRVPLPPRSLPGPPLYVLFTCWLYAYYCFDYQWTLRGARLRDRLALFEGCAPFFAGESGRAWRPGTEGGRGGEDGPCPAGPALWAVLLVMWKGGTSLASGACALGCPARHVWLRQSFSPVLPTHGSLCVATRNLCRRAGAPTTHALDSRQLSARRLPAAATCRARRHLTHVLRAHRVRAGADARDGAAALLRGRRAHVAALPRLCAGRLRLQRAPSHPPGAPLSGCWALCIRWGACGSNVPQVILQVRLVSGASDLG